jgi:hypothetical protein
MQSPRTTTSTTDVATEVTALSAGLGILTTALFPISLPGLLLFAAPLVLLAVPALLLAGLLMPPLLLARTLRRARSRRRDRAASPEKTATAGYARGQLGRGTVM